MPGIPQDKLEKMVGRWSAIQAELNAGVNQAAYAKLTKEFAALNPVVATIEALRAAEKEKSDLEALIEDPASDKEMIQMARADLEALEPRREELEQQLKIQLLPKDAADERSAILEVRAGTGGDEAALFARDLYEMYKRHAEVKRWKIEVLDHSATELGGFKEISLSLEGEGVYRELQYESGGHRVQRVPATETQGRIHTSAATVAVMPEPEDVEVNIKTEDYRLDKFCASGPGGQHVNKTESAVRLTHYETGIVVQCQDEKSQHKNIAKALRVLKARVYEVKREAEEKKRSEERKTLVGSGDRSQRIRTYNFPDNRVTDHRIGLTLYKLDQIIAGNLQPVTDALIEYDRQQLRDAFAAVD